MHISRPAALPKPIIISVPRPHCWKGSASKPYVELPPHTAPLGMGVGHPACAVQVVVHDKNRKKKNEKFTNQCNQKNPPSCGDPQPSSEKIDFQLVTSVNVVVHRGREFGLTFLPFGLQKIDKSLLRIPLEAFREQIRMPIKSLSQKRKTSLLKLTDLEIPILELDQAILFTLRRSLIEGVFSFSPIRNPLISKKKARVHCRVLSHSIDSRRLEF